MIFSLIQRLYITNNWVNFRSVSTSIYMLLSNKLQRMGTIQGIVTMKPRGNNRRVNKNGAEQKRYYMTRLSRSWLLLSWRALKPEYMLVALLTSTACTSFKKWLNLYSCCSSSCSCMVVTRPPRLYFLRWCHRGSQRELSKISIALFPCSLFPLFGTIILHFPLPLSGSLQMEHEFQIWQMVSVIQMC